jgi:hypothetical protein
MVRYGLIFLLLVAAAVFSDAVTTQAQDGTAPPVTFSKEILPILQKNCQSCHRPGQIAPMSLLTYEQARPWARAIKAKVMAREMPPWFADPKHGVFANDRSLPQAEIDTIAKWVDAGAPQGDPKDAPPPREWTADGWQTTPDIIVRGPEFRVPARPPKNVIEWSTTTIPSGFTTDTWVTSMEVKPSDLTVTHHICLSFVPHRDNVKYYVWNWNESPRDEDGVATDAGASAGAAGAESPNAGNAPRGQGGGGGGPSGFGGGFACYVPGVQADDFRKFGAAKLIPANSDISIQVHYTPTGKEVVDRPFIGFTLAATPPEKQWISYQVSGAGPTFAIPPQDPNYKSPPAEAEFGADVWLVQMMPHMHLRGKDMTYHLIYPDGRDEIILDVPKYDFNWQIVYNPMKPIFAPKGTRLYVEAHYNNSASNKFNPDPNRWVYRGRMTWEEMFNPFFAVITDVKTDPKTVLKLRGQTRLDNGA